MKLKIKVLDPEVLADAMADFPDMSEDELRSELESDPNNMIDQEVETHPTPVEVHWCADDPDYTLSPDGKYWVNKKNPDTMFCNLPEEEHEKFREYDVTPYNISFWCSKCSDMCV